MSDNSRDVALRMSKAFKDLGYFLFERDELEVVSNILKGAKLGETLKVVHLGDVKIELAKVELDTGYYVVVIDYEDCLRSCGDNDCVEKCVKEKRESVSQAVLEGLGKVPSSSEDELSKVYRKLLGS